MAGAGSPTACLACRSALPDHAKFCPECGTPTVGAGREVRKTVTLLFTDLAGSTVLGESLEPEAYRDLMGRYFAVARAAVERHGGSVEKFVGDAVLAVFGVPHADEDDALRAVRAAVEVRDGLTDLSKDMTRSHGVTVAARIGVNTGPVVVGPARAGGSFATGDAVNVAARLEQAAGPGEILLGAETCHLVRDAVEVEPVGPIRASGKSGPVVAYRLVSVHPTAQGRARRLDDPLIGRTQELRALEEAFAASANGGPSEVMTIVGAAGMGKTRLIRDFCQSLRSRALVAEGRCLSYGQGISLFPLAHVVRSALQLAGNETPEVVRKALEDALDLVADRDDVVGLLLPILGAGGVPGSLEQTGWAVRRLVEVLVEREPVVVVVDDLHWAEPSLLQLLEQLKADLRELPVLLVVATRPEPRSETPGWPTRTLILEQFTPGEIRERAALVLGGDVTDDLASAVTTWSSGNPLFVEEILAHLVGEGQVRWSGTAWDIVGRSASVVMPPSIASILTMRLDRIPARERHLLERVAVIGLDFTTADAALLVDEGERAHLHDTLDSLVERDLLGRVEARNEERWTFRHIVIREAAYDALPKSVRADLHERFADALQDTPPSGAGAERQAFVGHHLEQAVRLRRAVAPREPRHLQLAERAATTLRSAAAEARRRDDVPGSIALLNRAIDLPSPPTQRDLLVQLLESLYLHFQMTEVHDAVRRLEELTDESASPLDRATVTMEALLARAIAGEGVDPRRVVAAAERLRSLASDADDPVRLARAIGGLSDAYGLLGRCDDQVELADTALQAADVTSVSYLNLVRASSALIGRLPLSRIAAFARSGWQGPIVTESENLFFAIFDAISLTVTDPGAARSAVDALSHRVEAALGYASYLPAYCADLYYFLGDLDQAERWYGRVASAMGSNGDLSHGSSYVANQAFVRLDRGDPLDRVVELHDVVADWVVEGDVGAFAQETVLASVIAARSGDHLHARDLATTAVRALEDTQLELDLADAHRRLSECARLAGDRAEERRLLTVARDRYHAKEVGFWAEVCRIRLDELGQ